MITIGFTFIGRGGWSGGETYQRNMFGVMQRELAGKVRAKLFLTPEQHQKVGNSFDRFLAVPAIVDARVEGAGSGTRALKALATGQDKDFAQLISSHGIDVMFENAQWFGNRFPVPVVSWIPDFQHRYMQALFSKSRWWRRDIGFRAQTSGRRTILLSSNDARNDCEKFYPASIGKTHVVKFAIDLDPTAVHARAQGACERHKLPKRFFYLPNQFWSHKNHSVVVAALKLLKASGELSKVAPIYLTGRTDDAREPHLFGRLMDEAKASGVSSHFIHLGLIPYEDVFALNAAADALINPSKFEGWSTTVEEAKALGTQLILSQIGIHQEQAPNAHFFAPDDAQGLATILASASRQSPRAVPNTSNLIAAHHQRRQDYATALLATFESAVQITQI
jgi:glycosyltransferase involved in cell wall biosynthesis